MKRTMLLIASIMLALLVAAGVALAQDGVSKVCNSTCSGTDGDDQLSGTSKRNAIEGRNGADQIEGNGAKDTLNGNLGADAVYGGNGEDKLYGGGNDDYMQAGIKSDYIGTGSGNDVIAAKDGFRDQIYCGSNYDRVYVDRIDVLHRCEKKLSEEPQPQLKGLARPRNIINYRHSPKCHWHTIAAAVTATSTERLHHLLTDADWDSLELDT